MFLDQWFNLLVVSSIFRVYVWWGCHRFQLDKSDGPHSLVPRSVQNNFFSRSRLIHLLLLPGNIPGHFLVLRVLQICCEIKHVRSIWDQSGFCIRQRTTLLSSSVFSCLQAHTHLRTQRCSESQLTFLRQEARTNCVSYKILRSNSRPSVPFAKKRSCSGLLCSWAPAGRSS